MGSTILTVTQINRFLKSLIEGDGRLANILVAGELSNFTRNARSGHIYFSLKDENAVLKGVMFARAAKGLRFLPSDGMRVLIRGRISVYEAGGQYQLYAEEMRPDGAGDLALAFEQLKARLEAEGLFDESRKRPLPPCPTRIGVITSPTGAALRDILDITARRWPVAEIVLYPSQVQGDAAVPQLILALEELNRQEACDVIIIGRGGGSMEDLWAFNNESLARTVAWSRIPVVSAVGHQTDFTICDFAADVRAPTPSAAAELCTPDIEEIKEDLLACHRYFRNQAQRFIDGLRQRLDLLMQGSPLRTPDGYVQARRQVLESLAARLEAQATGKLESSCYALGTAAAKLDALSPLKVLSRGYAVVYHQGKAVKSLAELPAGEAVLLQVEQDKRAAQLL